MKKLNENDGKNLLKEIKRTFLASACGTAFCSFDILWYCALQGGKAVCCFLLFFGRYSGLVAKRA